MISFQDFCHKYREDLHRKFHDILRQSSMMRHSMSLVNSEQQDFRKYCMEEYVLYCKHRGWPPHGLPPDYYGPPLERPDWIRPTMGDSETGMTVIAMDEKEVRNLHDRLKELAKKQSYHESRADEAERKFSKLLRKKAKDEPEDTKSLIRKANKLKPIHKLILLRWRNP